MRTGSSVMRMQGRASDHMGMTYHIYHITKRYSNGYTETFKVSAASREQAVKQARWHGGQGAGVTTTSISAVKVG